MQQLQRVVLPCPLAILIGSVQRGQPVAGSGHQASEGEPGIECSTRVHYGLVGFLCFQGCQHTDEVCFGACRCSLFQFRQCLVDVSAGDMPHGIPLTVMLGRERGSAEQGQQKGQ